MKYKFGLFVFCSLVFGSFNSANAEDCLCTCTPKGNPQTGYSAAVTQGCPQNTCSGQKCRCAFKNDATGQVQNGSKNTGECTKVEKAKTLAEIVGNNDFTIAIFPSSPSNDLSSEDTARSNDF